MANEVARRQSGGTAARRPERRTAMLENARLMFRNFSGKEGQYNREGDRNFAVALDQDVAELMIQDRWNVKFLKPRDEGDEPQAYVQVSVNFRGPRPPKVVIIYKSRNVRTTLTEDEVSILDWAEFDNVDLILSPYEWAVNGKTGVKAYLQSIYLTIREDELEVKYSSVPELDRHGKEIGEPANQIEGAQDVIVLHEIRDDDDDFGGRYAIEA